MCEDVLSVINDHFHTFSVYEQIVGLEFQLFSCSWLNRQKTPQFNFYIGFCHGVVLCFLFRPYNNIFFMATDDFN